MALRCDALILGSLSDLCWLLVFADKRGEAFTEKERHEAARVEPWDDTERPHDEALITPEEGDCCSGEFEARRNEDLDVEGLDVFPITVAGSILNARNGTRSAALIPRRRPPARKKPKEKRKGLIVLGVSGLNSSYDYLSAQRDFSRFSPPIGFGAARDHKIYRSAHNRRHSYFGGLGLTSISDSEAKT